MRFLRLGAAGLRGEVGTALTHQLAIRYASALGTWVSITQKKDVPVIGVATDTRASSEMLKSAVFSGLLACECSIVDFGIMPSAVLHFGIKKLKLDGGILIGAGHHPAGWNALVGISASGACLTASEAQEMLEIYHGNVFRTADWKSCGTISHAPETVTFDYVDDLFSSVDIDLIRSRNFRIVTDFCNGSGSVIFSRIARKANLDAIVINDSLSGKLPHDPEPRPRTSAQVKAIMKPLKADAGFVFSSDVGRVALVTDTCETLSEEYTFPLVAENILSGTGPGKVIATNSCSTRTLDQVVARHCGKVCKGMTGETYTIDLMKEKNAVLCGDGSGGTALSSSSAAGFDGFSSMMQILELMARRETSLSALAGMLPRYHIVKRTIPCRSVNVYAAANKLIKLFPDAEFSNLDGLRFDWEDGWVHIRPSRTEPSLRMILEWKSRAVAEEKAMNIISMIERVVGE